MAYYFHHYFSDRSTHQYVELIIWLSQALLPSAVVRHGNFFLYLCCMFWIWTIKEYFSHIPDLLFLAIVFLLMWILEVPEIFKIFKRFVTFEPNHRYTLPSEKMTWQKYCPFSGIHWKTSTAGILFKENGYKERLFGPLKFLKAK